jgi:transcriptional regulator with XRE-family HTH domain
VIKARRQELGLTQEDLALRVCNLGDELRQSDISRMEHGKITLPRYQRMSRLAAALELSLGDLLGRAGWGGAQSANWDGGAGRGDIPDRAGAIPDRGSGDGTGETALPVSSSPHMDQVIARAEASLKQTGIALRQYRVAVEG